MFGDYFYPNTAFPCHVDSKEYNALKEVDTALTIIGTDLADVRIAKHVFKMTIQDFAKFVQTKFDALTAGTGGGVLGLNLVGGAVSSEEQIKNIREWHAKLEKTQSERKANPKTFTYELPRSQEDNQLIDTILATMIRMHTTFVANTNRSNADIFNEVCDAYNQWKDKYQVGDQTLDNDPQTLKAAQTVLEQVQNVKKQYTDDRSELLAVRQMKNAERRITKYLEKKTINRKKQFVTLQANWEENLKRVANIGGGNDDPSTATYYTGEYTELDQILVKRELKEYPLLYTE